MTEQRISSPRPVLSMGETLVDIIVSDGADSLETATSFVARAGGAPANVAVALARLGIPSAFCGVVGRDPFGFRLRRELAAEGVDLTRLREADDEATALAFAWKDSRGDGNFWLLRGADTLLGPEDIEAAAIADVAALVIGSVSLAAQPSRTAIEQAVDLARAAGVPVIFDVNLRPAVWDNLAAARAVSESVAARSDLVKLSLDDARGLIGSDATPEQGLAFVMRLGPAAAVLTDGEEGCWLALASENVIAHIPAFSVSAVEPTGAGDAFTAALIGRSIAAGWLPLTSDDLRYAAAAGALATTKAGAWDGLPSQSQLEAFLERNRD